MLYTSKPENVSTDTLKIAIDEILVKNVENKGFFDGVKLVSIMEY